MHSIPYLETPRSPPGAQALAPEFGAGLPLLQPGFLPWQRAQIIFFPGEFGYGNSISPSPATSPSPLQGNNWVTQSARSLPQLLRRRCSPAHARDQQGRTPFPAAASWPPCVYLHRGGRTSRDFPVSSGSGVGVGEDDGVFSNLNPWCFLRGKA